MPDLPDQQAPDLKLALEHSWAWFSLHAGQRMQLTNFYFASIAFLTAGYATSTAARQYLVAGAIGILGCCIGITFSALDARTQELIKVAEPAIAEIERRLGGASAIDSLAFITTIETPTRRRFSYGRIIKLLTLGSSSVFMCGALLAFIQL